MSDLKFTVIYDTYCGWCYGAAPIFDALLDAGAQLTVLHRHLFQGALAYRMRDGKGALVQKADARIHALTGQPFSARYTRNIVLSETEVLASHYSAQAAALVHDQGPHKEFALRRRLEHARFVDGVSASDRAAVVAALRAEGLGADVAEQLGTTALIAKTDQISRTAANLMAAFDAQGVPTLLKAVGETTTLIDHSAYYGRPQDICTLLHSEN